MKKIKRILSVLLIVAMTFAVCSAASAAVSDTYLKFNSDGKFKILVFADCQDDILPDSRMINMIENALDKEKPDLVVFPGDNVVVSSVTSFKIAAKAIIKPLIDRDIPYAYTFGNHDDENGVSKEDMHDVYMSLGTCLTYDADPSIHGLGNCNIPIYSSDGSDIAFNLWMIDSLAHLDIGGYDYVREDQLNWYRQTSAALEAQVGHKVNSLMFQHIAMQEIYNLLVEDEAGVTCYPGKKYRLELNSNAYGYIGEFPGTSAINGGQFDVLKEVGDVIGVVTGHDHVNAFRGTYDGVEFVQMPGMSFQSYGDDVCRGYGVIELDEKDTSTFASRTVTYDGFDSETAWNNTGYFGGSTGAFISEVAFAYNSNGGIAKYVLMNAGYTVVDVDLNQGCTNSNWVYMGYKTTDDPSKAIREIRFYASSSDTSSSKLTCVVNGKNCEYIKDTVDLNAGAGGNYIYGCVSYDVQAGPPITWIGVANTANAAIDSYKVCGEFNSPSTPANLNKGTNGTSIYCYTQSLGSVDISTLSKRVVFARPLLDNNTFQAGTDTALTDALTQAELLIADLEQDTVTAKTQADIDALVSAIDNGVSQLRFEVEFVNFDGTVIETLYAPYGGSVSYDEIPTRPSDEKNHYTFSGWDSDSSLITKSMTVTALYTSTHYHSSNGSALCTENEICQFCGEILRLATEHSWGEWTLHKAPTVTDKGVERLGCVNCSAEQLRETQRASTATVENSLIFGFTCNLSPDEIDGYFNDEYVSVQKNPYNGKVMGTNSTVTVTQGDTQTVYTVVIFGDTNGDGWYDGQDAMTVKMLVNGMLTREDVGEAVYMASDCNHDGVIDEMDIALLNEAGVLLASVDQSMTDDELQASSAYAEYIDLIDQSGGVADEALPDETEQPEFDFFTRIAEIIKVVMETIIRLVRSLITI